MGRNLVSYPAKTRVLSIVRVREMGFLSHLTPRSRQARDGFPSLYLKAMLLSQGVRSALIRVPAGNIVEEVRSKCQCDVHFVQTLGLKSKNPCRNLGMPISEARALIPHVIASINHLSSILPAALKWLASRVSTFHA